MIYVEYPPHTVTTTDYNTLVASRLVKEIDLEDKLPLTLPMHEEWMERELSQLEHERRISYMTIRKPIDFSLVLSEANP
ncbi:hypothetical protein [Vibrio sp. TBV020]|uniref:hypothetical protein n=1 Tax=Vibrio sp. TBV020 TaxID=3137398 RepID=UPI0038CD5A2A